jgi:hypothetical protein
MCATTPRKTSNYSENLINSATSLTLGNRATDMFQRAGYRRDDEKTVIVADDSVCA